MSGINISSTVEVPKGAPKPTLSPREQAVARKLELLKKVKNLREGALFQRGRVLEGNPAKEYCWVNIRDDRQYFFQSLGWSKVVKESGVKTQWEQGDGTHVRGDLILYEIDKEMFEAMQAYNELRGVENIENAENGFVEHLQANKIPVYKPQV